MSVFMLTLLCCHGNVEVPPMIASVSIAAAGAIVANNVLWINLEDLLNANADISLPVLRNE